MGNPKKAAAAAATATNENDELHTAARTGDLNVVQKICSFNPLAVNSRDRHSRTPLHLAAWSGHGQVMNFLCKNKADVGAAAMDDMGAIHFAAQKGHIEVVRILVTSGVSVKSRNRKGMTALHYAAQGSHLELARFLVKKGANVTAKNKAGKTPIDLASSEEVRYFLTECQSGSSKAVLDEKEKPELLPENEAGEGGDKPVEEEDKSVKRKGDENVSSVDLPETKKAKVALKHLLAADDAPEEEDDTA